MNTLTIEALPEGLELTPSERAWDTFDYIKAHPQGWDQKWYGNRMMDGNVYGCFAHHVVARAGFTITNALALAPNAFQYVPAGEVTEQIEAAKLVGWFSRYPGYQVEDHILVPTLAQHLLGYRVGGGCDTCFEPRLFCPGNDLTRFYRRIEEVFGPKPVAA